MGIETPVCDECGLGIPCGCVRAKASSRRVLIAVNRWIRSGKAPEDLRRAWEEYMETCRSAGITEEF